MKIHLNLRIIFIFCLLFFLECATTVPKEAITLSELLGKDLIEIQTSYQALIRNQYSKMRNEAELFVKDKYIPFILKSVIEKRKVLDNLNNKVSAGEYEDALNYLTAFSKSAFKQINKFRDELLGPINEQEQKLLMDIDGVFQNMRSANSAITSHLASIRKTQLEQDTILEKVNLKEFKDEVFNKSIGLSNKLSKMLENFNITEETNTSELINNLKNVIENFNQN